MKKNLGKALFVAGLLFSSPAVAQIMDDFEWTGLVTVLETRTENGNFVFKVDGTQNADLPCNGEFYIDQYAPSAETLRTQIESSVQSGGQAVNVLYEVVGSGCPAYVEQITQ